MRQTTSRALIVDDDRVIAELIGTILFDSGWDVQIRTRSHDALRLLRDWVADVIVLDLSMSDMDTETFLSTCRQQTQREIPILLLSASSKLNDVAERLGVNASLAKPFDIDQLCASMRRLVCDTNGGGTGRGTFNDGGTPTAVVS